MKVKHKAGIYGLTALSVEHSTHSPVKIRAEFVAEPGYNAHHLLDENWSDFFPGNVLVPCPHCRQWAARKTECKHCGAAVS